MKKHRIPIWLPYLELMEITGQDKVRFKYNGGDLTFYPKELSLVMIYGTESKLDGDALELLNRNGVPIIIHRRNVSTVTWIHSGVRPNKEDLLDRQLLFRRNGTKCRHITRRLLEEKLKAMKWLINIPDNLLKKGMPISKMRIIEAQYARRYWQEYMKQLGVTTRRRDRESQVRAILDAASKFTSGIILRWVCYHHLSPFHGFCHEPTDYPSLVYDLMEPYRPGIEKVVWLTIKSNTGIDQEKLMAACIQAIKEYLDEIIYVGATNQYVTTHELLHGIVLALRSYLVGNSTRFIVPIEEKPNGGRRRKVGYKLYGRNAGRTNFHVETRPLSSHA